MFAVEMKGITKAFGENIKANDSVDLSVRKGEIHAVVGENGAGKSTLMKILYGMYRPDKGKIFIGGSEKSIDSPSTAIKTGIGMVHQHFMLAGTLTVLENIILGDETTTVLGLIDKSSCRKRIKDIAEKFGINIDLDAKVENLSVGTQQKIEIIKILYRSAEILILDEPTAVLTPQESQELFFTLKELKSGGRTIILISHKLSEVLSVSDNITVLRHGKVAGTVESSTTNSGRLAEMIIGSRVEAFSEKSKPLPGEVILSVRELVVMNDKRSIAVNHLSFEIKTGEILGIAGVEGNGQKELIETISGMRKAVEGKVIVNGKPLNNKISIAHIPQDRQKYGMVSDYTIAENVMLGRQREEKFSTVFAIKNKNVFSYTDDLIERYDIRPADVEVVMGSLSGGNQQKVVVSRELTKDTELIIASHPTRGLDIKAAGFVQRSLLDQRENGKGVLLVSSDLQELLLLSDRIAVIYNGKFSAILDPSLTNEVEIGKYMTGTQYNEQ